MLCLFHKSDYDGICSAAIVKHKFPECSLYGMQYGDPTPWDTITVGETVYLVDFSLPADDMLDMSRRSNLIYIDHHKSAMEENKDLPLKGIQRVGTAACALVWEYLFETHLPYAVKLLSDYDVWRFDDPNTLPFQYGMRLQEDTSPGSRLWTRLLSGNFEIVVEDILRDGKIALKYVESNNAYYADAAAVDIKWQGFNCVVINKLFGGSDLFKSVFDPDKDEVMISFGWLNGKWKVGLRSLEDGPDVSVIALEYGGGGHAHAAGFSCDELPFKLK